MECSDIEDDEFCDCESGEKSEIELFYSKNNDNEIMDKENVQESSESEFENILNLQKRRYVPVHSSS